jgi:acetyl-CoA C-acetyltransferase
LKDVLACDLAAIILNEVASRVQVNPGDVDKVILGQSFQNSEYVNIARMALLKAGWPDFIPGILLRIEAFVIGDIPHSSHRADH